MGFLYYVHDWFKLYGVYGYCLLYLLALFLKPLKYSGCLYGVAHITTCPINVVGSLVLPISFLPREGSGKKESVHVQ